ncbi:SDR family NAD(P)-dependent oxidoreductase [Jiangella endophytica]|uniref:SDR family NAD(P)-dependent oxidoreductase n=1 Tax=Jiangella endophytica TaxID=1623398 RepID=UPI0013006581|nr:SDR family oxidoreductase [Jiangella endophytica]
MTSSSADSADGLDGHAALITGGTSGIGAAIADALEARGCRVVRHGLAGGDLSHDLSAPGSGAALADAALRLGPVDIVVSSASVQRPADWRDTDPLDVEEQLRTNVIEPFDLIRRLLPAMVDRGWGRVLTVGSVQQSRPHPRMLAYAASKAAQFSLVRNLAGQVAAAGVTVNNLSPGVIDTPRNAAALADPVYRRRVVDAIPAGRLGSAGDCVPAAVLLCSPAGAYITGQDIVVDGGFTL